MPVRHLLPRRTLRLRVTALYGVPFILSSLLLLVLVNLVVRRGDGGTRVVRVPPGGPVPAPPTGAVARALADLQSQQAADLHQLLIGSALGLGLMAVVSIVLGWIVAGRLLRPLRTMTATARHISEHSLHERLAVPGPGDELKDLGDTIDGLLERLEGAFSAQRRFVANASHELRTPLATMRALVDVAAAKPGPVPPETVALAARLRGELDRVDELLEGLLVLARAQHGAIPGSATVSLGGLAAASLAGRAAAAAAMGLSVRTEGDPAGGRVRGGEALLARMVDNVIDNAIRHNQPGGWIRVEAGDAGAVARLVVESGGPVLDPGQVGELAQPFRRIGADRTGSERGAGLGLSIVAAVAEAHGGRLDLGARPEGGLRVAIELPPAEPSP